MNTIENAFRQSKPGSLKYLKSGDYMLVDNSQTGLLKWMPSGAEALLLEPQGSHNNKECWYAYACGAVIVVWQDSFVGEQK
jgi:hypothetical protein